MHTDDRKGYSTSLECLFIVFLPFKHVGEDFDKVGRWVGL